MLHRRPLGRAVAAALVLSLLGAGTSVAAAATRDVASTGSDVGDCVATSCATLEYAQRQVQTGDSVRLAAGVYPVGDATFDVDDVTYERNGPGEAKITLPGDSYGIRVGGHDITFRDLTVSSPDDTIQGDTWGFTYEASGLTLDRMRVQHLNQGVVFGHGITVTNSTFTDIAGTALSLDDGLASASDNVFTTGGGIYVKEQATVAATGNDFRGNAAGDGGQGIWVDEGSAGGTVTGNRFSPSLDFAIHAGQAIQAPDNWWGCNEGGENAGCAASYDLPAENAEPHLVLGVSASPNPFLITGSSAITASLISSDPQSTFVGGPIGAAAALSTTEGSLDDSHPFFVAGVALTTLRANLVGFPTVTATLDNASASSTVEAIAPAVAQTITFTSVAPTAATVGGTYALTATGGASGNPVSFSIDPTSTTGACTISGATVSFTGTGQCVINANQLGNAGHTAAAQQQQTVTVSPAPVTSASLSPGSFAYDAVNAGAGGVPQSKTFTLVNTGNRDITVQAPTLTGSDRADYVVDSVDCADTLHPADRCTYVVTFAPITVDATYDASARLHVQYAPADLAPGESELAPATVDSTLSGRVNEAPLVFEAASGQVDLGSSTVATATAPRPITFTNTGHRVVRPEAVSVIGRDSGSFAVTADTCTNRDIAPAGSCSVAVSFAPAAIGAASATLHIAYGAGTGAVNVGLTGTGLSKPETTPVPDATLLVPSGEGILPVPLLGTAPPAVLPLELRKIRTPVRCLTYGAATPKKSITLQANANAKVGWTITKARGSKAWSACPSAPNVRRHPAAPGKATGSGVVQTDATGSATVKWSTLLPAKVRKAMKPGLYRVTFVARNVTGSSPERVILVRVLKQKR